MAPRGPPVQVTSQGRLTGSTGAPPHPSGRALDVRRRAPRTPRAWGVRGARMWQLSVRPEQVCGTMARHPMAQSVGLPRPDPGGGLRRGHRRARRPRPAGRRGEHAVTRVGVRGRSVLVIGIPLWLLLTPEMRVAVLAHELGHLDNRDPLCANLTRPATAIFASAVDWTGGRNPWRRPARPARPARPRRRRLLRDDAVPSPARGGQHGLRVGPARHRRRRGSGSPQGRAAPAPSVTAGRGRVSAGA